MINIPAATVVEPFVETKLLLNDEPIRAKGYRQIVWTTPSPEKSYHGSFLRKTLDIIFPFAFLEAYPK